MSSLGMTGVVVALGLAATAYAGRRIRPDLRARNQIEKAFTILLALSSSIAILTTLGIVLSVLLIARVDFIVLAWPITSLLIFAAAALVVGLIAAVFPARRASRLNVLEALQYE